MSEFNKFFVEGLACLGAGIGMIAGMGPVSVSVMLPVRAALL